MLAPGKYWPGTQIRLTATFDDSTCTDVDPVTVTFKTYSPCGVLSTYVYGTDSNVGKSATGNYYADISPTEMGRWNYRWETTGTGTTLAIEGDFLIQRSRFYDDCWSCGDYR